MHEFVCELTGMCKTAGLEIWKTKIKQQNKYVRENKVFTTENLQRARLKKCLNLFLLILMKFKGINPSLINKSPQYQIIQSGIIFEIHVLYDRLHLFELHKGENVSALGFSWTEMIS